jgi:hypothetical protein
MKLDALELHDSIFRALDLDFLGRLAIVKLDCYLNSKASSRTPITLQFTGVQDVTCTGDWDQLKVNSRSGNVNYWVLNKGEKPTYIYLMDGCVVIRAKSIRLLIEDGKRANDAIKAKSRS